MKYYVPIHPAKSHADIREESTPRENPTGARPPLTLLHAHKAGRKAGWQVGRRPGDNVNDRPNRILPVHPRLSPSDWHIGIYRGPRCPAGVERASFYGNRQGNSNCVPTSLHRELISMVFPNIDGVEGGNLSQRLFCGPRMPPHFTLMAPIVRDPCQLDWAPGFKPILTSLTRSVNAPNTNHTFGELVALYRTHTTNVTSATWTDPGLAVHHRLPPAGQTDHGIPTPLTENLLGVAPRMFLGQPPVAR